MSTIPCSCDQNSPRLYQSIGNHICICLEVCNPSVCRASPEKHPCTCTNTSNDTSTCCYIGKNHECICGENPLNGCQALPKDHICSCLEVGKQDCLAICNHVDLEKIEREEEKW